MHQVQANDAWVLHVGYPDLMHHLPAPNADVNRLGSLHAGPFPVTVLIWTVVQHLHIAFIQSALQYCLTFTLSYTDGGANHARQQPTLREQLGLGVLLRDTSTLS